MTTAVYLSKPDVPLPPQGGEATLLHTLFNLFAIEHHHDHNVELVGLVQLEHLAHIADL